MLASERARSGDALLDAVESETKREERTEEKEEGKKDDSAFSV